MTHLTDGPSITLLRAGELPRPQYTALTNYFFRQIKR